MRGMAAVRLAVLTNVLSPYRVALYNELVRLVGEMAVFLSGAEDNRSWQVPCPQAFATRKTSGIVVKRRRRAYGRKDFDVGYLHIPVGTVSDLAAYRPSAVLSTGMGARTLFAWLYCTATRTPLAVHWGGTLHTDRNVSRLKRCLRRSFFARVVRAWVSYGQTTTEYLLSLGVPKDRVFEATNCVDNDLFSALAPPSLTVSPRPVLLYVGQFVPRKGLGEFLEAASLIQRKGVQFSVVLVGRGLQEAELRAAAGRSRLRHLQFHPFTQPEELPGIYRSADVFVFPTLEDVWGLVVNEALLSGIPVLCSKHAGCARDLVPETWQFEPLDIEGSFVPKLEMAIARGSGGRSEFIPVSEIRGPREAARAIMAAIERAAGRL